MFGSPSLVGGCCTAPRAPGPLSSLPARQLCRQARQAGARARGAAGGPRTCTSRAWRTGAPSRSASRSASSRRCRMRRRARGAADKRAVGRRGVTVGRASACSARGPCGVQRRAQRVAAGSGGGGVGGRWSSRACRVRRPWGCAAPVSLAWGARPCAKSKAEGSGLLHWHGCWDQACPGASGRARRDERQVAAVSRIAARGPAVWGPAIALAAKGCCLS